MTSFLKELTRMLAAGRQRPKTTLPWVCSRRKADGFLGKNSRENRASGQGRPMGMGSLTAWIKHGMTSNPATKARHNESRRSSLRLRCSMRVRHGSPPRWVAAVTFPQRCGRRASIRDGVGWMDGVGAAMACPCQGILGLRRRARRSQLGLANA
jgi:hypothetical protein